MQKYYGRCHCGSVSFIFKADEIASAMRCSCSICRRKSAYLSNFVLSPDAFELQSGKNEITEYKFGTGVAKHYFCKKCGIFTHVETRLNPGFVRVNLGCVDSVDVFSLPVTLFDGDSI